jgi:hypothetical protein
MGPTGVALQESFSVHLDTDLISYPNNTNVAPWNDNFSSEFYTSTSFNLTTGVYTVPMTGMYLIMYALAPMSAIITINGTQKVLGGVGTSTIILRLVQNDTVSLQLVFDATLNKLDNNRIISWWSMSIL